MHHNCLYLGAKVQNYKITYTVLTYFTKYVAAESEAEAIEIAENDMEDWQMDDDEPSDYEVEELEDA